MLRSTSLKNFASAAALLVFFACGDDPKTSMQPPAMNLCGNGTIDDGELCDDGNASSGDYCSSDCQKVIGSCGDGRVQFSVEACDDGGTCQAYQIGNQQMHMPATFRVISVVSYVSGASRRGLDNDTSVLFSEKVNLRAFVRGFCVLTNWAGEREKVISCRFDFKTGGRRSIKVKSTRV